MNSIKRFLADKRGNMYPYAVAVVLAVLMILSCVIQEAKAYSYTERAKAIVSQALTAECSGEYAGTYYGIRDGVTANYIPDGSGVYTSGAGTEVIEQYLTDFGFTKDGSDYILADPNGNTLYSITGLSINTANTMDGSEAYKVSASFTIRIPMWIAGNVLPSIQISMTAQSGYVQKY